MSITLYRKYRPLNFETVFGQNQIKTSLINSLNEDKLAHAYLFNGPRGVGKTTIARIIAKGINCLTNGITSNPCMECENCIAITNGSCLDVIEIDAASNRGIDEIRNIKEAINYSPVTCRKKVYIIDEIHMLTNEAFNALLKTLEEPPAHIIFILATTEIHKLPDTIISRCVCYNFKILSSQDVIDMLSSVCKKENINIDEQSLQLIYEKSSGSARDSFSILEQLISSLYNEKIDIEKTKKVLGIAPLSKIKTFDKFLNSENKIECINFIDELYKEGIQIEQFLKDYCEYLKDNINENTNEKIKQISIIYETINQFKNEDDIRIISYIILNRLFIKNVKILDTKTTKVDSVDFDYQKFLDYLIDAGELFLNNILLDYSFDKIMNYNIYIVKNKKVSNSYILLKNELIVREIEECIYNFCGQRYCIKDEQIHKINSKFKDFRKLAQEIFK